MASRRVPTHTHVTRDIKPLGICPGCDDYHERRGLTREEIEDAFIRSEGDPRAGLRLLRMMRDVDADRHAELVKWIGEGVEPANAVDEAMGEWPEGEPETGAGS